MRRLSIRVDVDTHTGLRDGVPRLLDLLLRLGVRASFFITMGPDNSGRAIRRLFTRKGFARKMARTNALRTYALRTILSGTLLPSRPAGRWLAGSVTWPAPRICTTTHEGTEDPGATSDTMACISSIAPGCAFPRT